MTRSPARTLVLAAASGLLSIAAQCDAGPSSINNCPIISKVGEWGQSSYSYDYEFYPAFQGEQTSCPVRIAAPDQRVYFSGDIYDNTNQLDSEKQTKRARLRIINRLNQNKHVSEHYSDYISPSVRKFEVFGDYLAMTAGGGFSSDYDFLEVRMVKPCCLEALIELKINYQQAGTPRVGISGNQIPLSGTTETYYANSVDAAYPQQYSWSRDGVATGSGGSYTTTLGTAPFTLRVDMTAADGQQAAGIMKVDVDGVRTSVSGPVMVWYSGGGGSWSASVSGGYPPYTINWYVDGAWVGSGGSWTGYPGEGFRMVHAAATDSRGRSFSSDVLVEGIGNETCAPEVGTDNC